MTIAPFLRGKGDLTRGRKVTVATASVIVLLGAVVGAQLLTAPGVSAKEESPCERTANVGEVCHYLNVVSNGPDYDIYGWLRSADQRKTRYTWEERNPQYTTWWYRYDQNAVPDDRMFVRIDIRWSGNIGYSDDWPMTENRCLLITESYRVVERPCPNEGPPPGHAPRAVE